MLLTHTETINASLDTVFGLLTDPAKQLLWRDGLVSIEPQTGGVRSTETFHKGRKKMVFTIESEVVEFEKPTLYTTRIRNADFSGDVTYRLDTVDGATRLVSEADMTYRGNAVARFLGQMAAHHNRADMKALIRIAESA